MDEVNEEIRICHVKKDLSEGKIPLESVILTVDRESQEIRDAMEGYTVCGRVDLRWKTIIKHRVICEG